MDDITVVDVADLRRHYGPPGPNGFDAVRGVSFSVRRGELFALLGTNGAGKTSTLEVLEGLAPASSGAVRVLGHDPYRERRRLRPRTGIMLQDGGFPADLTVRETLRTWAGTLSAPRPLDEALELSDLSHRAAAQVKQLSGGEKRRLDLAVAVLGRPEVLFLDEPTAGLDPQSRARTRRAVRSLLAAGTTVLLTTHDLSEAAELADRLAILHAGEVVRSGTPAEVSATRPARLSFTLPAQGTGALPRLPGVVRTHETGGTERRVVVESADLQATLTALLSWAASASVVLGGLDARSASLEEAFLAVAAASAGATGDGNGVSPARELDSVGVTA
jgi:ABC-2 type transport system ATP-binding protein